MKTLAKIHKEIERERLAKELIKVCDKEIIAKVQMSLTAATVLVLHDKFGFGKKRLAEYICWVGDYFDSVHRDFVSFDDIKKCIYDELGIDFELLEAEKIKYFHERGVL